MKQMRKRFVKTLPLLLLTTGIIGLSFAVCDPLYTWMVVLLIVPTLFLVVLLSELVHYRPGQFGRKDMCKWFGKHERRIVGG